MNTTILDIAERAKVSKSTVSRVLNKSGYVSDEARKKVETVISELNFVPSAMAQGLSKSVANTIGVLIPEMGNDFFTEVLSGISDVVDAKDMTLLFSDTANNAIKQDKALQMFKSQRVKGLILTPAIEFASAAENRLFLKQLDQLNMPIVIVDRNISDSRWDSILFENFNAGYLATKAMLDAGRKKIGIITGDMRLAIARERFNGYTSAMKEAGLPVPEDFVLEGDFTRDTASALVEKLLSQKKMLVNGLVTSNNLTSIGLMYVLDKKHIKIGRDIAAVGIDRVRGFYELGIPFSHVERDTKLIGRRAVEQLLKRIDNPEKKKERVMIPARLVLEGTE